MSQFFEPEYLSEWRKVTQLADDTVQVQDAQGNVWTVVRDVEFLAHAPVVFKNGAVQHVLGGCDDAWSPCLTSAKWLLMVMQNTV